MIEREYRTQAEQLRMQIRQIEADIQILKHEEAHYRRLRFSADLHRAKIAELITNKNACELQLKQAERRLKPRQAGVGDALACAALAPAFAVMGLQSLFSRQRQLSDAR